MLATGGGGWLQREQMSHYVWFWAKSVNKLPITQRKVKYCFHQCTASLQENLLALDWVKRAWGPKPTEYEHGVQNKDSIISIHRERVHGSPEACQALGGCCQGSPLLKVAFYFQHKQDLKRKSFSKGKALLCMSFRVKKQEQLTGSELVWTFTSSTMLIPVHADEPRLTLCQKEVRSRLAGWRILWKGSKYVFVWADRGALFGNSTRLVLGAEMKLLREERQPCSFSLTRPHSGPPSWNNGRLRNHALGATKRLPNPVGPEPGWGSTL